MENIKKLVKKAAQKLRSGAGAPDFWGLVRALENAHPSKPRIGCAETPGEESIRFSQAPFLNFPAADIAEIAENTRQPGVDAAIVVYFFGLLGVNGPMPLEFTSYVFRRSYNHFDNTWRRFLDIIHHRFLAFYCRAYSARQQAMSFDRGEDDVFSEILKGLAGFAPNVTIPEREEKILLKSVSQFSGAAKNRRGLEGMLRQTLGLNLEVKEFICAPYDIPQTNYTLLGKQSSTLGVNLQIGRTHLSVTGQFEIHIGPLHFAEYQKFMSSGNGAKLLTGAVDLYLDRPLNYSVVFTIRQKTIPLAKLGFGREKKRPDAPQLGYTCWIGNQQEPFAALTITKARLKRGI